MGKFECSNDEWEMERDGDFLYSPMILMRTFFGAVAVELAVEDLFPRPKIELAISDGDDDFAAHDLAFHVGVGVVFAGAVVLVLGSRGMRGEMFEPLFVVFVQAGFVVVDEDGCGDVHGVGEKQTFLDAGFADGFFTVGSDVDEAHAGGDVEGEVFGVGFHAGPRGIAAF